jgi:hypothetical protein
MSRVNKTMNPIALWPLGGRRWRRGLQRFFTWLEKSRSRAGGGHLLPGLGLAVHSANANKKSRSYSYEKPDADADKKSKGPNPDKKPASAGKKSRSYSYEKPDANADEKSKGPNADEKPASAGKMSREPNAAEKPASKESWSSCQGRPSRRAEARQTQNKLKVSKVHPRRRRLRQHCKSDRRRGVQ